MYCTQNSVVHHTRCTLIGAVPDTGHTERHRKTRVLSENIQYRKKTSKIFNRDELFVNTYSTVEIAI